MSGTGATAGASMEASEVGTIDMKLEVVTLPVSDIDRAKGFYQSLGWRFDGDIRWGEFRGIQSTPPRSECSISFGPSDSGSCRPWIGSTLGAGRLRYRCGA